jgi:hypothetical protein
MMVWLVYPLTTNCTELFSIQEAEFCARRPQTKSDTMVRVKYWEIIADNLSKAGWSWGCVSAIDSNWRTMFVADAHRDDGKRFVVRADEKLTAFWNLNRRFG